MNKENTFDKMSKANETADTSASTSGELNLDDFSSTAIGDKVKYVRPNLDKTEDVIEKFQVFMPDINKDTPKKSQSGKNEYWSVTMILTYASKNEDEVQNREYISGCIVFKTQAGTPSEPSFWYEGCSHQSGYLWEKVAESKGISADELSPREFIAFLNNKPKIEIVAKPYKNYGAAKGSPAFINKNMVEKFL